MLVTAKKVSAVERQLKKEEEILEIVAEKKALMGVSELAKGIQYSEPIKTRSVDLLKVLIHNCVKFL